MIYIDFIFYYEEEGNLQKEGHIYYHSFQRPWPFHFVHSLNQDPLRASVFKFMSQYQQEWRTGNISVILSLSSQYLKIILLSFWCDIWIITLLWPVLFHRCIFKIYFILVYVFRYLSFMYICAPHACSIYRGYKNLVDLQN